MNQRSSQTKFSNPEFRAKLSFGGSLLTKSKNRHARPVSKNESMHLVLKSSKAKGRYSFRHGSNSRTVQWIVENQCAKYGVRLIKFSNNFNHLHLLLKFTSRALYLKFIRSITGQLAMAVTGACKTRSLKSIFGENGFWDYRPFTRIVKGRRGFKTASDYVRLNQLEADGVIPKRDGRIKDLMASEREYFSIWPAPKSPKERFQQQLSFIGAEKT
jgi:REP element-mobilizing transposase RayT